MGRKKGKQSFGFTSKAQRAVFSMEWQSNARDAVTTLRHHVNHSSTLHGSSSSSSSSRVAVQHRLKTLRNMLQERVLQDELEHRETSRQQRRLFQQQHQQQHQQPHHAMHHSILQQQQKQQLPPPGSLLYYTEPSTNDNNEDEDDEHDGDDHSDPYSHRRRGGVVMLGQRSYSSGSLGPSNTVARTDHATTTPSSSSSMSRLTIRRNISSSSQHHPPLLSLQMQCVQTLGPILPQYLQALGVETLHHYLSLLPGPTLTALSVVLARHVPHIHLSRDLICALGNHCQVQRLVLYRITDATMLQDLLPRVVRRIPFSQLQHHVPECWEDEVLDGDEDDAHQPDHKYYFHHMPLSVTPTSSTPLSGCTTQLQRLELGHFLVGCRRWTSMEPLRLLLETCGTTLQYLGLIHSLHVHTGPGILLLLPTLVPHLRMLDVSDNDWITESLLRQFWQGYLQNLIQQRQHKQEEEEEEHQAQVQQQEHDDDDDTNTNNHSSSIREDLTSTNMAVNDDDDDELLEGDSSEPFQPTQELDHGSILHQQQHALPRHIVDMLPVVRALACPNLVTSMKLSLEMDFSHKLIHSIK